MSCSVLWVNTSVTPRPSAGGPDQLSPLPRFKTCLIGFPKRPRRGKGELVTSPSVPVEGGGVGGGSLISHRWTPPVAINQSQSPAGARRGSTAGREREGGRARSLEPSLGLTDILTRLLPPQVRGYPPPTSPPQVRGYPPPTSPPPLL